MNITQDLLDLYEIVKAERTLGKHKLSDASMKKKLADKKNELKQKVKTK